MLNLNPLSLLPIPGIMSKLGIASGFELLILSILNAQKFYSLQLAHTVGTHSLEMSGEETVSLTVNCSKQNFLGFMSVAGQLSDKYTATVVNSSVVDYSK